MGTPKRRFTAEDLWRIRRVGEPAPGPGGDFAIVGVTSYDLVKNEGRERLFRVAPGCEPVALTAEDVSASSPVVSPDGQSLVFLRKAAGRDARQVHILPLRGGEARVLADFPLGARSPRFMPDGKALLVLSNVYRDARTLEATRRLAAARDAKPVKAHVSEDRVVRFWDRWLTDEQVPHLFLIDLASGDTRDLTPDLEALWDLMDDTGEFDIRPDGAQVAFSADVSRSPHTRMRYAIHVVSVNGGPVRCLTPENPSDDTRPRYSPDGTFLVFGAKREPDSYADRVRLVRLNVDTLEQYSLSDDWDRSARAWEFTAAQRLLVEAEDQARVGLFRFSTERARAPELVARSGSVQGLRVAGEYAWLTHHSLLQPPEVVRISTRESAAAGYERVSTFNDALMAEFELGDVHEHRFEGALGEEVQAFVITPPRYDATRRWPLVHLIHGGPYGTFGDAFHYRWCAQVFAAPGYVCAMVNFHGSSSYGDAWAKSINGDWGGKAAEDILRGTDSLLARFSLDPQRVAISGGSFGGYLTAWLATQSERFACAIAHAAVYNLNAMYSSDVTQGVEREIGGEPWGGPEAQTAIDRFDPARHAVGFQTPLLVIHGEKDYRVPHAHGLELYGILKAKGVPARLVVYPDENHWILKPLNSLHWYAEFLAWLARYIGSP